MNEYRAAIHTTISKNHKTWLHKESRETGNSKGKIIELAIDFYRNNKIVLEEYKQARIFLKELIQSELLQDYTKARPILKRIIDEELNKKEKHI